MDITARDLRFFEVAKRLSKKSNHHRHHLGCVITKGSKIVGLGFNQMKTHRKSNHPYHMLHAEIHAILGVPVGDLRGSTVYVYRENYFGDLSIAKPCPTCQKMLFNLGIKKVIYTSNKGYDSYLFY